MSEHTIRLIEILHDELAETKRKLEIAVKGLSDIKRTVDPIADESNWGIIVFLTIEQCLKDLERVKE